jgi:hypothetical protein
MFIRKTRKLDPETKKAYFTFQLIESIRTEKGPRQRILLNMGSHLDLNQEDLKLLANRIEEVLKGVNSLIVYSEAIEHYAQQYASQLVKRLSTEQPKSNNKETAPLEFINIEINSI